LTGRQREDVSRHVFVRLQYPANVGGYQAQMMISRRLALPDAMPAEIAGGIIEAEDPGVAWA